MELPVVRNVKLSLVELSSDSSVYTVQKGWFLSCVALLKAVCHLFLLLLVNAVGLWQTGMFQRRNSLSGNKTDVSFSTCVPSLFLKQRVYFFGIFFFFLKTPFSLLEKWLILEYYFGLGPQNNSLFFVFAKAKNGGIVQ